MSSSEGFTTRLLFDGRTGIAKLHGVWRPIYSAPQLGGRPVAFIDYRPEHGRADVRFDGEDLRPLTDAEVRECDSALYSLTQTGRQ